MAIHKNIQAREASNTLIELGITLAKEEGLEEPETIRRFWQYVMETAGTLIGDEVSMPEPKRQIYKPATVSDADLFPFGKHEGEPYSKVPDNYFKWLAGQDWVESRWPDVFDYIQENDFG